MSNQIAEVPKREKPKVGFGSMSVPPQQLLGTAERAAEMLKAHVVKRKLTVPIANRHYVRVEGWATLGALVGVTPSIESIEESEDGSEFICWATLNCNGQIVSRACASCGTDEKEWSKRDRYARRSMAETRAVGKAFRTYLSWVMAMAGYETTPAEEMPTDDDKPHVEPPY